MKKLLIIALLISGFSASAQKFILWSGSALVRADKNQSVDEAFKLLSVALPGKWKWFDRYVLKDGVIYYRPCIQLRKRNHIIPHRELSPIHG